MLNSNIKILAAQTMTQYAGIMLFYLLSAFIIYLNRVSTTCHLMNVLIML